MSTAAATLSVVLPVARMASRRFCVTTVRAFLLPIREDYNTLWAYESVYGNISAGQVVEIT